MFYHLVKDTKTVIVSRYLSGESKLVLLKKNN